MRKMFCLLLVLALSLKVGATGFILGLGIPFSLLDQNNTTMKNMASSWGGTSAEGWGIAFTIGGQHIFAPLSDSGRVAFGILAAYSYAQATDASCTVPGITPNGGQTQMIKLTSDMYLHGVKYGPSLNFKSADGNVRGTLSVGGINNWGKINVKAEDNTPDVNKYGVGGKIKSWGFYGMATASWYMLGVMLDVTKHGGTIWFGVTIADF